MFEAVVDALGTAPDRLRAAPEQLRAAPARLRERRSTLQEDLQVRARKLETQGREGLWRAQTRTLERAEELLEKAEELPVVKLVAEPAERLVQGRLDHVTAVPVEGYAELNARNAVKALAELDHVGLLCVRRWEKANKDRKTVLTAIDKLLA